MGPVAYLVIGEPHYRELFFEHGPAMQAVVEHHGLIKNLVLEETVSRMLAAAYQQGIDTADRMMS
jgi:hypothetical protein